MRSYTVTPLHTEVPAWEEIPALQVDNVLWLPDSGVRMTQQLCYDAKYLYVRQQAWEQRIRAQRTGYLQQVCEDSCMEFFFAPLGEERYFNLEINPNGCVRLGFGTAEGPRTQLVPRDMEQYFAVCPNAPRTAGLSPTASPWSSCSSSSPIAALHRAARCGPTAINAAI